MQLVINNVKTLENALAQMSKIEQRINSITTKQNAQYNEHEVKKRDLVIEREQISIAVRQYCVDHRHVLFGDHKTMTFKNAEITFRTHPPSIQTDDEKQVIESLQKLGLTQFLRVKTTLDRSAMIKNADLISGIDGIEVISGIESITIKSV